MRRPTLSPLFGAIAALLFALPAEAATLISRSSSDEQGNTQSRQPAISADGRYVAFQSDATNLVAGDSNGFADIFLHDRWTGMTSRISVAPTGGQAAAGSERPAISADGNRIVFASHAALLPGAGYQSCYLLDRRAGTMQLVNLNAAGVAGGICGAPSIDLAGNRIAFSTGDPLEPGDDNGRVDVYLRDLVAGLTRRISRAPGAGGSNGASDNARLSGDGSMVVYASEASNLVAGDSNAARDIFRSPSSGGDAIRISVGASGVEANGSSHAEAASNLDGSLLAFSSNARSLPDPGEFSESTLYLRVPSSDSTFAISLPTDASLAREGFNDQPDLSATGQYLVFASTDDLLLDEDTSGGIYVIDLVEGLMARVSQRLPTGSSGNHVEPRISADGSGVVWTTNATNQLSSDTNGHWDVVFAANPLHPRVFASGFEP